MADERTQEYARLLVERCHFSGATYVEHGGEAEVLPGIRLLPAPGHTDGHQVVVVETDADTNALGGDVGTSFRELGSGTTAGQHRVLALGAPAPVGWSPLTATSGRALASRAPEVYRIARSPYYRP